MVVDAKTETGIAIGDLRVGMLDETTMAVTAAGTVEETVKTSSLTGGHHDVTTAAIARTWTETVAVTVTICASWNARRSERVLRRLHVSRRSPRPTLLR